MKKIYSILLILSIVALGYCKSEEAPAEEETATETGSGSDGSSSKVKAYEDFVTKFCALSEKLKTASATESIALTKEFTQSTATYKTMSADMSDLRAASSEAQRARIDAATKKGSDCAAATASAKLSAPDIKKEIPKEIPKEVPKLPGM
jgi:hypothetical protein